MDAGTLRKACDTTGTATASGYAEPAFTWDVAVRLRRLLRASGATVVLTRSSNAGWGPCITERAAIGNRAGADAAVSIHADGGPSSGRGFHVIYPPSIRGLTDDIAQPSKCLALAMRRTYRAGTGAPLRDVSRRETASRCARTSVGSTSPTCPRCSSRRGTCGTGPTRGCSRARPSASASRGRSQPG